MITYPVCSHQMERFYFLVLFDSWFQLLTYIDQPVRRCWKRRFLNIHYPSSRDPLLRKREVTLIAPFSCQRYFQRLVYGQEPPRNTAFTYWFRYRNYLAGFFSIFSKISKMKFQPLKYFTPCKIWLPAHYLHNYSLVIVIKWKWALYASSFCVVSKQFTY
jgi:hypothetical protein